MIEHVIVVSDDVMQSTHLPFRHPQGPVSEWPEHLHDIRHYSPFILCCEEWPVIILFWIFKPLMGEFSKLVGLLKPLHSWIPLSVNIYVKECCDWYFSFLTVNEVVLTSRCQRNQYRKHSLLYEGQSQVFQNVCKSVHSQLSLLNLVS